MRLTLLRLAVLSTLSLSVSVFASPADHREFDAMLHAPYRADANARSGDGARTFTLNFEFPGAGREQAIGWRMDMVSPTGRVVQRWYGLETLRDRPVSVSVPWAGRSSKTAIPDGIYTVRLVATANDAASVQRPAGATVQTVEGLLARNRKDLADQTWSIQIGNVAGPAMPKFVPLLSGAKLTAARAGGTRTQATPAPGSLAYTVYYGNLHSQTNHSDGGGNVATCTGAQAPQSGAYGPADAYQYAANRGLDFLMTSEHNHLYDGSTGTNASAVPATAHNLYQSGLTAASGFNSSHQNFLGLYGMEWGVISNGGHLNIFGSQELFGWESNGSGQLISDVYTAKGDYASLYTLMRQRNLVGQFNHPATSTQFTIGGVDLAYTADGDQVMATCEVLNSSAFSSNTTETETGRSNYEAACNKLLEAGYHVAFSTDQDNHCANWGASFTNRTGVLLPTGAALTQTNFLDAMRARRVFATMDKNSQLVLTANGHVMGERFANSGALNLVANFANSTGRSVSTVAMYEGVPGRNGSVSQLSSSASTSITPATGEHFYYAKVTQDDGNILWSAPVWVSQGSGGGGDVTPPTVSASESGTSGTITVSANASDNVGVTRVEFYIDGSLQGTLTAAPYTLTVDSTALTNGAHALVAKAYDAANNVGASTAANFSISNGSVDTTPPTISVAESGSSGTVTLAASASDNVGVTKVELYVDSALKGTLTSAPYSLPLNSTTLSDGSHSLLGKAYDAANNVGTSAAVAFTISNGTPDTTPPTVSATESGSSGSITLSASASDNVGVTKVEFYVDGALKGSSTAAPYSVALDSTTLANGSHTLVAKAYDAANNVGTSAAASFSVSNGIGSSQLMRNGGFESGNVNWSGSTGVITAATTVPAHTGTYKAWLDGYGVAHTDTLYQAVTIPASAASATLTFWLQVISDETTTTQAYDTLKLQVRSSTGTLLSTLATYSNLNKGTTYRQKSFDMSAWKGQTVRIHFVGTEDTSLTTTFLVDDVSLIAQ